MKDAHARTPINETARRVISRGFHFESTKRPTGALDSETPPPVAPRPSHVRDLTGVRQGRLTVIAYYGLKRKESSGGHKKRTYMWAVRCDCGMFSVRGHRAIVNETNDGDRCDRCRHLDHLQRFERFRRAGVNSR